VKIIEEIKSKKEDFRSLCENHKVGKLYAFGSSIRNDFSERESDIDLLIEINVEDAMERGENLISIWNKLESFFQRKVDLLTYKSIKNPILKRNIDATKILIYEAGS
jgi:uncharacterized protein|tara:strand:+ start:225190 stop:225510 length:321 start_codon:yes stop_codon:yes gene_type:complete